MMWGNHGLMGGYMWILWIAVLVGLIFLIKWIIQLSKQGEQNLEKEPLEILKKRYVRGEIGKEDFEQRKKDLLSR